MSLICLTHFKGYPQPFQVSQDSSVLLLEQPKKNTKVKHPFEFSLFFALTSKDTNIHSAAIRFHPPADFCL